MTGSEHQRIVLQERDRHLLQELAVMRVIDREQAKCVAGFGSTTRANARLLALTKAGLIRRFFLGTSSGGKKALYALSPKGAGLIDVAFRGPRRKQDEVLVADFFVSHQLLINDVFCRVKYGTIPVQGARFLRWVGFHKPVQRGIALIPDGYFEVAHPAGVMAAFLEVDLGHESLGVWRGKVQNYLQYAISGDFKSQSQFRVLVIATTERRMQSIRATVATITEKIFWFATVDSIKRDSFWSPLWLRPRGNEQKSLL